MGVSNCGVQFVFKLGFDAQIVGKLKAGGRASMLAVKLQVEIR